MEHPLDLSGREDEPDNFPSRDDPICQVVNCSCPLKHIMQLDGPTSTSKTTEMQMPKLRVPGATEYQNFQTFSNEESYKRQFEHSENSQIHHKKMKLETNEDNNIYSSHYGNTGSCSTRTADQSDWNDRERGIFNTEQTPCHRERSKSATFIQTLPKKRAYMRSYSPELSSGNIVSIHTENSHVSHENSPKWGNKTPDYTKNSFAVNDSHNFIKPSSSVKAPRSSSATVSSERASAGNSFDCDVSALKADMIREIDNEKDDEEDVSLFKKRLNESFTNIRERIRSMHRQSKKTEDMKNDDPEKTPAKENSMTSLDYMISKTLMQSEDRPFKPRNNHIHEIIRGEKSGQLCLMDLMELQVEIGLA